MNLLYFKTTQCEPCKAFLPVVQSIANEFSQEVAIHDANVSHKLARVYMVQSVPKVVAVNERGECIGVCGVKTPREFRKWMERVMR